MPSEVPASRRLFQRGCKSDSNTADDSTVDLVNFDSWKLTSVTSCGVQAVSSFRCHVMRVALLVKTMEFPDIKINTGKANGT